MFVTSVVERTNKRLGVRQESSRRHDFLIKMALMVEFSQSPGAHSYQNEEEDERPQNFHNKSHLE